MKKKVKRKPTKAKAKKAPPKLTFRDDGFAEIGEYGTVGLYERWNGGQDWGWGWEVVICNASRSGEAKSETEAKAAAERAIPAVAAMAIKMTKRDAVRSAVRVRKMAEKAVMANNVRVKHIAMDLAKWARKGS